MRGNLKAIGEGILGGLVGGALVLGVYAVVTTKGADGGDWLQFLGVIFGVAATMTGTLEIERRKERAKDKVAFRNLRSALDDWTAAVAAFPAEQSVAAVNDLKQQLNFIGVIGPEVSRDARATNMAVHAFTFHVPAMIDALRNMVLNHFGGPGHDAAMDAVLGSMRDYANNIRMTLPKE